MQRSTRLNPSVCEAFVYNDEEDSENELIQETLEMNQWMCTPFLVGFLSSRWDHCSERETGGLRPAVGSVGTDGLRPPRIGTALLNIALQCPNNMDRSTPKWPVRSQEGPS